LRRNTYTDVFKHINLNPTPPSTCWLWRDPVGGKGIPYFNVNGRKIIAYRLVYWLTHPDWDINNTREFILHTCVDMNGNKVDNPLCCNPEHLRPGTHEQNMIDMMLRGRSGLTIAAIRDILKIAESELELTHGQIASRVAFKHKINVGRSTVTSILNGDRRKKLKDALDQAQRDIDESGRRKDGEEADRG
jgi:hypothetical protein